MTSSQQQSGFTLILFLLALMGAGGIALAGITQEILKASEEKRYEHNNRVLQEAKNALLMYAYNYPNFNSEGPGRLPCPDEDNDGLGDANGSSCIAVGRFPWDHSNMDFYEAKDASGETLWYAVSDSFHNLGGGPATVNSDSTGTISIYDKSGSMIYDGATNGVAAVIIAPGEALARDEDNNATNGYEYIQVRNTSTQKEDPKNYLEDHVNGMDNSVFVNSSNTLTNSFVLGPVRDGSQKRIIINDQIIVVTAEEVIAMAEKATLDAYQKAISDYQFNIWGSTGSNYRYPWLDDYNSFSGGVLTEYDADINTVVGRVPVVFDNYFSGNEIDAFVSDTKFVMVPQPGAHVPEHQIHFEPPSAVSNVSFDVSGDLLTSLNSSGSSITRYFWDGHPTLTPSLPMDGVYELCPGNNASDEEDCNMDNSGNFIVAGSSDVWLQVYELTITFDSGSNPFTLPDSNLTSGGPSGRYFPPSATDNAYIFGAYNNSGGEFDIDWEYDADFRPSFNDDNNGTLNSIEVGVVYYPEVGVWASDNDWHSSIQMAVAQDYRPDGAGDCITNAPCLTVQNLGGINTNKVALLTLAGSSLNSSDDGAAGYSDDLAEIFEAENADLDSIFTRKIMDDKTLILREQ